MRIVRFLSVLGLAALVAFPGSLFAKWLSDTQNIMGTRVHVELWSEDIDAGRRAIAAVMQEMRRIEAKLSPYIESSELARLNRTASEKRIVVSDEFFELLQESEKYAVLSAGAFDISFASVGYLYEYRSATRPSDLHVEKLLPAINYRAIKLDAATKSVRFGHPELKIDLGGIAKGYAVDRGIAILRASSIKSAIVSAGGDSRILGDRGDRPWVMGIRHPRKADEYAVKIPLENTALSTSGDYERFFTEESGERIHHILNPTTGKSAKGVQSVSVLAPNAIDSDALSTSVFVLGVEQGLRLINRLAGIDAIIIDGAGKLHYSTGLLRSVDE